MPQPCGFVFAREDAVCAKLCQSESCAGAAAKCAHNNQHWHTGWDAKEKCYKAPSLDYEYDGCTDIKPCSCSSFMCRCCRSNCAAGGESDDNGYWTA